MRVAVLEVDENLEQGGGDKEEGRAADSEEKLKMEGKERTGIKKNG